MSSIGHSARARLVAESPLLLWYATLALALAAQKLISTQQVMAGKAVYAVAAMVAVVAFAAIERQTPLKGLKAKEAELEPAVRPASSTGPRLMATLGVTSSLAAAGLVAVGQGNGLALALWLGALVLVGAGVAWGARRPMRIDLGGWSSLVSLELLAVAAIVLLTLALRLWDLESIPRDVHGDEAAIGLEARRLMSGEAPTIFAVGWYDVPMLSFAIPEVVMKLFGNNLFGLRLASVLQGTLSVVVLYLLGRRLFGSRVAVFAATLLAVAQWHIHFSRGGFHYMQAVLATVLVLYFLVRGLQTRRALDFVGAGFACGLAFEVYYAARLAPVLAVLYVLQRAALERGFLRQQVRGLLAMALGVFVFLVPMAAAFVRQPQAFMSRTAGVWIFTPGNLQHELGALHVDSVWEVLRLQAQRTLEAFNISGESSLQYTHPAPLVDFWTGALLVVGVVVVTLRGRDSRFFLLASWFWLSVIVGSVLTIDAPFSPRLVAVTPALALIAALVLDGGWRAAAKLGGATHTGLGLWTAVVLVMALRANVRDYFEVHANQEQPPGFFTVLSSYIGDINERYQVHLTAKPDTSLRYDTVRFLLPGLDGIDAGYEPLPLQKLPNGKGVAFLIDQAAEYGPQRLVELREVYPGGREGLIRSTRGQVMFTSYLVESEVLAGAAPNAAFMNVGPPAPKPPSFPYTLVPLPARATGPGAVTNQPGQAPTLGPARPLEEGVGRKATLRLGGFRDPRAVAVSREGTIYVADRGAGVVWRFEPSGEPAGSIGHPGEGPGGLKDPRALAIDASEQVVVLDSARAAVSWFGPDGSYISGRVIPDGYGPNGLALAADGTALVADTGKNRIVRLESGGTTTSISFDGSADTRFEQPTDVAVAPDGEVIVADPYHRRLAVLLANLQFKIAWPAPTSETLNSPHLAVAGDRIYLTDPEGRSVIRYDRDGHEQARLGRGEFQRPVGIGLDAGGRVYVVDVQATYVFRYDPW